MYPTVAIAPVVAIEDVDHGATNLAVLVCRVEPGQVVEERTARQADRVEQLVQRVGRPQGINQLRLLPVRQEPLVDAQIFFYQFVRLFQQNLFKLQMSDVSTKRLNLLLQRKLVWGWSESPGCVA